MIFSCFLLRRKHPRGPLRHLRTHISRSSLTTVKVTYSRLITIGHRKSCRVLLLEANQQPLECQVLCVIGVKSPNNAMANPRQLANLMLGLNLWVILPECLRINLEDEIHDHCPRSTDVAPSILQRTNERATQAKGQQAISSGDIPLKLWLTTWPCKEKKLNLLALTSSL